MYRREFIEEILSMYLNGASVLEISEYVGLSIKEVNGILDVYVPLM